MYIYYIYIISFWIRIVRIIQWFLFLSKKSTQPHFPNSLWENCLFLFNCDVSKKCTGWVVRAGRGRFYEAVAVCRRHMFPLLVLCFASHYLGGKVLGGGTCSASPECSWVSSSTLSPADAHQSVFHKIYDADGFWNKLGIALHMFFHPLETPSNHSGNIIPLQIWLIMSWLSVWTVQPDCLGLNPALTTY